MLATRLQARRCCSRHPDRIDVKAAVTSACACIGALCACVGSDQHQIILVLLLLLLPACTSEAAPSPSWRELEIHAPKLDPSSHFRLRRHSGLWHSTLLSPSIPSASIRACFVHVPGAMATHGMRRAKSARSTTSHTAAVRRVLPLTHPNPGISHGSKPRYRPKYTDKHRKRYA